MNQKGFSHPRLVVELETYRLLSIFQASAAAAADTELPSYPEWWEWFSDFERIESSRLLISIAVMARNGFDSGQASGRYADANANAVVGRLQRDVTKPDDEVDLTCREACNKIIHADSFRLLRDESRDRPHLTGLVEVEANYRGKDWLASIKVSDFAIATVNLIPS